MFSAAQTLSGVYFFIVCRYQYDKDSLLSFTISEYILPVFHLKFSFSVTQIFIR